MSKRDILVKSHRSEVYSVAYDFEVEGSGRPALGLFRSPNVEPVGPEQGQDGADHSTPESAEEDRDGIHSAILARRGARPPSARRRQA